MYGTQTQTKAYYRRMEFENDVKMYGTQTISSLLLPACKFENDVKMYGIQTPTRGQAYFNSQPGVIK